MSYVTYTNLDICNALKMKLSWFELILALNLVIFTLFCDQLFQLCFKLWPLKSTRNSCHPDISSYMHTDRYPDSNHKKIRQLLLLERHFLSSWNWLIIQKFTCEWYDQQLWSEPAGQRPLCLRETMTPLAAIVTLHSSDFPGQPTSL